MNETILTPRQKSILNLIDQSEGLLREEIQERIKTTYPFSKLTLIRDLNILFKHGLIKFEGKARATKYLPKTQNPLFRNFDVERYFADDTDKRVGARKYLTLKYLKIYIIF